MSALLRHLADNERPGSPADRFRQRRFLVLRGLIDGLDRPARILDVGGTSSFWQRLGYAGRTDPQVILLNRKAETGIEDANLSSVIGDAADLSRYGDDEFEMVVSNSLIEHFPTFDVQATVAAEARRVGKRVYLQTPNRYFPLEPHFLFPFFALLPIRVRVWLVQHFRLGWRKRVPDRALAEASVRSIRLMTGRELQRCFPTAHIQRERVLFLTKSFVVLDGWNASEVPS